MFKKSKRSSLNKALRIGYLQLKKVYGEDEVQEQAAEIWKLTSEEESRLAEEGVMQVLSTLFVDELAELFNGWKDKFTDWQWEFIETNILQRAELLTAIASKDEDAVNFLHDITPVRLRIRKLTPRECFRLMDVDDEDIDKIQAAGISNSGQYKLAGNSICVGVLYHLFRKAFVDTEPEQPRKNEVIQLTLF